MLVHRGEGGGLSSIVLMLAQKQLLILFVELCCLNRSLLCLVVSVENLTEG